MSFSFGRRQGAARRVQPLDAVNSVKYSGVGGSPRADLLKLGEAAAFKAFGSGREGGVQGFSRRPEWRQASQCLGFEAGFLKMLRRRLRTGVRLSARLLC